MTLEGRNIFRLLELMEETMEEGTAIPFGNGKRVVDVDQMRDIIDEVRGNLPDEVRQARAIVKDRADIISEAKREAEMLVKKAEERARIMLSEQEIVRAAQVRATEIISGAQSQSREMRNTLTEYCENMLRATEEQLIRSAGEIKNVRTNLRQSAKKG